MNEKVIENNGLMKRASYASLGVALTLIILKCLTFLLTGSVAILSSLFDSVQDMMTSSVNMIAIHHATTPADKKHRFGHGKAQALGSLIQAFIIAVASLFLLIESVDRFWHPQALNKMTLGLIITFIAIVLTLLLLRYQKYVIEKTGSLSIKADQAHYTGDILMNIGVMISMIISYFTGWTRLDALFGIGVSIYLFVVVYGIIKESFSMLMDTELSEEFRKKIKEIVFLSPEVIMIHDLKTRQSGSNAFIQFCVHLDENLTLREAHDITDRIEDKIKEKFPDAEVIIHPEPERKVA